VVAPAENIHHRAGRASLEVQFVSGESAVTSSYATNPLKLLTPRSRGQSVWAYTSSFGGGLVAGDQTRIDLQIGAGSRCFLGTQASTKIYRNPAALPSGHETQATLESGSLLVFAPDPVQAFAGSTYTQRQEFRLASDASLVLLDWFTSGRAARGEHWEFNRFQSRNEVWREKDAVRVDQYGESSPLTPALSPLRGEGVGVVTDARLDSETPRHASTSRSAEHRSALERGVHAASHNKSTAAVNAASSAQFAEIARRAPSPLNGERVGVRGEHSENVSPSEIILLDSLLLTPDDGALTAPHRMGRFNCLATLFLIGPALRDFARQLLEQVGKVPVTRRESLIVSASPVASGAVLRIAGEHVEAVARELHHHFAFLRELLGDDPWVRKW
jgi:urease accessory protein UreH